MPDATLAPIAWAVHGHGRGAPRLGTIQRSRSMFASYDRAGQRLGTDRTLAEALARVVQAAECGQPESAAVESRKNAAQTHQDGILTW